MLKIRKNKLHKTLPFRIFVCILISQQRAHLFPTVIVLFFVVKPLQAAFCRFPILYIRQYVD